MFLASNYLFIYGIKALVLIAQRENHALSDNSLPERIQEAVSVLKSELADIVLTRKEFNKIHIAINHCTGEIARLEEDLFPSVMQKLTDLNIEANQKTMVLEDQKGTLVGQIVSLLETTERWEKNLNEDNPQNTFKPTDLIKDAENLITGLKVIYPIPKEDFIPENHFSNEIPSGSNTLKIESCNSRGYIFGNKVCKKAEVKLERSSN